MVDLIVAAWNDPNFWAHLQLVCLVRAQIWWDQIWSAGLPV